MGRWRWWPADRTTRTPDGGGGAKGGEITISQTSQPDFLDPALSYTVNGWEPMWLVYTPPVAYKHAEGEEGTQLQPGVAEAMPEISKDGKTYTFTIRKGLKYSDGQPVKASDWEHTIKRVLNLESGGAPFYEIIEGADEYLKAGKAEGDISGITTDDETGEVTVKLTEPDGTFLNVMAMNFSGIVPGDTPFRNMTKTPPPGVGAYEITEVGAQPPVRDGARQGLRPPRHPQGQRRQDHHRSSRARSARPRT